MLVWINGPFGGGKTQTAHELHHRLPGSWLADPERIGFAMHRLLPPAARGDFQDIPAWRAAVAEVLDRAAAADRQRVVLVPMTLVEPQYFAEVVGRLRSDGHDVRHFSLLATRETVRRRLRERVVGRAIGRAIGRAAGRPQRGRENFAVARLDLNLQRLRDPMFAEQIWTDDITVAQVADRIAASAGLRLTPNTDPAIVGQARRAWVGVRHIRLG